MKESLSHNEWRYHMNYRVLANGLCCTYLPQRGKYWVEGYGLLTRSEIAHHPTLKEVLPRRNRK